MNTWPLPHQKNEPPPPEWIIHGPTNTLSGRFLAILYSLGFRRLFYILYYYNETCEVKHPCIEEMFTLLLFCEIDVQSGVLCLYLQVSATLNPR